MLCLAFCYQIHYVVRWNRLFVLIGGKRKKESMGFIGVIGKHFTRVRRKGDWDFGILLILT